MADRPDKMNFPSGLYDAAKKLRSSKERGEFLMAVLAMFYEGEEVEVSERPDLLLDGWRDRIAAMRSAALSGMQGGKAKAAARADEKSGKGEHDDCKGCDENPTDTLHGTLDEPYAEPTGNPSPTLGGDMRIENRDIRPSTPNARVREAAPPEPDEPPTYSLDEVKASFVAQGFGGSMDQAEAMFDHYATQGWVRGNGRQIRDLNAAVRTWMRDKPTWKQKGGGNLDGIDILE